MTIVGLPGAVHVNDYITIFAVCSGGSLWGRAYLKTTGWNAWVPIPGAPALSTTGNNSGLSVVSLAGSTWIFVVGTDGTVHTGMANQATGWTWATEPATPTGKSVSTVTGATPAPMAVYANMSDGTQEIAVFNGAQWKWSALATPAFAPPNYIVWDHGGTNEPWIPLDGSSGKGNSNYGVIQILFTLNSDSVTCSWSGK
jgi:hypothetical protein